ncbi:MAG TPA: DUF4252 domain-containing protein [Candidatus Cybelea sp.]|nr:DUF4252 domain-containing protein [Candidatus Cybelea sp.]
MKRIAIIVALLAVPRLTALAQDWDPGGALKRLDAKAVKTIDVNLDQSMLQFASAFLDPKDPEQAKARKIIADMKGIYVHNFEFDKPGAYTEQDVAAIREQLKGPEWSRVVNVRSKTDGQNTEVYFRKEGDKFKGLVVMATEPTEFTFVDIVGPITPEELRDLGGQFGIPRIEVDQNAAPRKGEHQ